jgi:hypothetical protein
MARQNSERLPARADARLSSLALLPLESLPREVLPVLP